MSKLSKVQDIFYELVDSHVFRFTEPSYLQNYPEWPGLVGLEMESFVLQENALGGRALVNAPIDHADPTVRTIHQALAPLIEKAGWKKRFTPIEGRDFLFSVLTHNGQLSFEPGGQLEIAVRPYPCLDQATESMIETRKDIYAALQTAGLEQVFIGVQPFQKSTDIPLMMPKDRYRAMSDYFDSIGPFGRRMMRQTCTMQVNVDFGECSKTMTDRYLAANLIAPFAAATFANAPFHEGTLSPKDSTRTENWRFIDPSRSGYPAGLEALTSKEDCVKAYGDYAFDARMIGSEKISVGEYFVQHLLDREPKDQVEWISDQLSLLFPEVRPRGFLELRFFDVPPTAFQRALPAYACGLMYDADNIEWILANLMQYADKLEMLSRQSVYGFNEIPEHQAIDPSLFFDCAQSLMQKSIEGLQRLPTCFRNEKLEDELKSFSHYFTFRRLTLGSALRKWLEEGGGVFSVKEYQRFQKHLEQQK